MEERTAAERPAAHAPTRAVWTDDMRAAAARFGRIGGLRRAALRSSFDLSRIGASGADALLERFLAEVDPDRRLSDGERLLRARRLYRAHMLQLAERSARVRRERGAS